jgi:molybdopterin-containing oxidoreductase family membrane subunit
VDDSAIKLLTTIVQFCLGIALFLTLSEVVVELYARTEHANGLYYLMFGLHGLTGLVPWFWSSLVLMVGAFVMFFMPSFRNDFNKLQIPCAMAFAGIWIEKGMGLIVPGYIPSPIGEVTEYHPSFVEWLMVLGIWAFGFFILTILLKGAIGIMLGEVKFGGQAVAAK